MMFAMFPEQVCVKCHHPVQASEAIGVWIDDERTGRLVPRGWRHEECPE